MQLVCFRGHRHARKRFGVQHNGSRLAHKASHQNLNTGDVVGRKQKQPPARCSELRYGSPRTGEDRLGTQRDALGCTGCSAGLDDESNLVIDFHGRRGGHFRTTRPRQHRGASLKEGVVEWLEERPGVAHIDDEKLTHASRR